MKGMAKYCKTSDANGKGNNQDVDRNAGKGNVTAAYVTPFMGTGRKGNGEWGSREPCFPPFFVPLFLLPLRERLLRFQV